MASQTFSWNNYDDRLALACSLLPCVLAISLPAPLLGQVALQALTTSPNYQHQ